MPLVVRSLRFVAGAVLVVLAGLALAEIALRGLALFARGREDGGPGGGAVRRIVCVGDSHTYGALVPSAESYPGHLQRLLDERAPGRYAVANLGIPGMSTTQVRARLHAALEHDRPDTVIVWCGVNNVWNREGEASARDPLWARLDAFATAHLRVYRLVRVWAHDRALERALASGHEGGRATIVEHGDDEAGSERITVLTEGGAEQVVFARGEARADHAMEDRALEDYRAMVADARAAGARIVFVAYPAEEAEAFAVANRALRRVFAETGAPLVDTWKAVQRVPPGQRTMLWAGHPNAAMYGEIARDVLEVVLEPPPDPLGPDAPGSGGMLARVAFEPGAPRPGRTAPTVVGRCPAGEDGAYHWSPQGGVCYLQVPLAVGTPSVTASARLRVDEFPGGPSPHGGYNVLGLLEQFYGTGVYLQLVPPDRLRAFAFPGGGPACEPLPRALERGVWYRVRLRAEKGGAAAIGLELLDDGGDAIAAVRCAGQATGGGEFLALRIGSGDAGASGRVDLDDVEVRIDVGQGAGGAPPPGS